MKITTLLFIILISLSSLSAQVPAKTGEKQETEKVKYDVSFGYKQLVYHTYRVTENTRVKRIFEDSTSNEYSKVVTHWFKVFVPNPKDENGFLVLEINSDSLDYKFDSELKKVEYASREIDKLMPINFKDFFQSYGSDSRFFSLTYSPYGDVAKIEGKDLDAERKNFSQIKDPVNREEVLNSISDNKLKFMFDVPKGIYPPFEASIDTSWKSEIRYFITNVPFSGEITNTFKGFANNEYRIESTMESLKLDAPMENYYLPDLDKYGTITDGIATGTLETDMFTGGTIKYVKAKLKAILAGKLENYKYNQIVETTYTWDLMGRFSY